jgi:hypothetical protein
MRLRRIARPLARKGLSVIAAFLLNQFPVGISNRAFRRFEIAAIVTDQSS